MWLWHNYADLPEELRDKTHIDKLDALFDCNVSLKFDTNAVLPEIKGVIKITLEKEPA